MSRPASVFIGGTLVTLVAGSLSIENRIEERSTASFTIIDLDASKSYQRGQVVEIYYGEKTTAAGGKLFAGFIETPEVVRDGNGLLHTIQCKDNHYLADKRLVVKSYTNQTLSYIVNDILVDYLVAEGISAGTIQVGPTIKEAIFNYVSVTQCFDALKELSGFTWQITDNKKLDFIQRDTNYSYWPETKGDVNKDGLITSDDTDLITAIILGTFIPDTDEFSRADANSNGVINAFDLVRAANLAGTKGTLTSTNIVDNSAHLSKGNPSYRNRQYIRGGMGITSSTLSEIFTGDAVTLSFTVGYPIAQEPTVTVADRIPEGQTVGIKGIETGFNCYWNKGGATITFAVAPENAKAVTIVYYGQYPLIARADSTASINSLKAIEGGTGIVEDIVHEAQHESSDAMKESTSAKLQLYCQGAERFSFQTRLAGIKPGRLLQVTYSPFGFSSHEMLIESVQITEEDSTHLIYSVIAITGPVLGSWSKFFSNILIRQDKSIKIGDALLLVLLQAEETLALTETIYFYQDEFAVSGNVNRWLNSAPISSGSLYNIQHERIEMTEVTDIDNEMTEAFVWQ